MPRDVEGRAEINVAPDERAQLEDHRPKAEHAGRASWQKLDKHVHITLRTEIGAQNAPEDRELCHAVPLAEPRDLSLRELDAIDLHAVHHILAWHADFNRWRG